MGMRRLPEAGPGSAETLRIPAGVAARTAANCVGAGSDSVGGMSQVVGDRGEHRAAGEILRDACFGDGMDGSDGARSGCIPGVRSRAKGGGEKWRVIRER